MMNEPVNKMELSEQNAILQKAKITKGDLPELLEKKGISYDALRYEEYCDLPQECLSPIETLDSIKRLADFTKKTTVNFHRFIYQLTIRGRNIPSFLFSVLQFLYYILLLDFFQKKRIYNHKKHHSSKRTPY